jgi:hypothetical protein
MRVLIASALFVAAIAAAQTTPVSLFPHPPKDLMDDVPADFPRFHFAGAEADAQWLSRYLWYHFSRRSGNSKSPFNQEFLTISDMWMAGALHPGWSASIQQVHRNNLLGIRLDPEGYVWTHQHFSHAHDHGWPFPMWTNATQGPEGFTAGWHFQQDGPGWVWNNLRGKKDSPFGREKAIQGWELENVRSLGIAEDKWQLESSGASPAIVTPAGVAIDAFNAPFLQLRWTRQPGPPAGVLPYVEWKRAGDSEFSAERRVYFDMKSGSEWESTSHSTHSLIAMSRHPLWKGRIERIRIGLAPGESGARFAIDSFFTVYDTRHTINNPLYVMGCWNYFRWTGDVEFLRAVISKVRMALRYQQTVLGGLDNNFIRVPWVGHDGIPGYFRDGSGARKMNYGHGIGNNYWDIMPFGGDDMYATNQYYGSLEAMADLEQAIGEHPGWAIPGGSLALDANALRAHAAKVKETANAKFWDQTTGRFYGAIDQTGKAWEYGFTFLNLDAIWYGIASDTHARAIMDWLGGKRIVEGDTSTGADIYHWRFGPRATTRRNLDWYIQGWIPERRPWGGQVQDGGAVLGFTFFDYWARLRLNGADDAWQRLHETLEWERDVWADGGYRKAYEGGKRGATLQGGNTAGAIGIDAEFWESSLVPAIVVHGFLGIDARPDKLTINPRLPTACPEMGVSDLLYRGVRLDVKATRNGVEVALKDRPLEALRIGGPGQKTLTLVEPGIYRLSAQ